ncbi:hypothetical protein BSZ35_10335 [Salinibacter sp. 10B]|uniref:hypothetical protein n=1 Tax=Salinibacter sp. 10B TaxID=1923971 RepID=UPI000CF3A205|nr:hypothetical protein [Salinibacter sp. 10B]PQJ34941.1 hypothetical protein BSZ35_10335 [Salinibacter sp. 10B]
MRLHRIASFRLIRATVRCLLNLVLAVAVVGGLAACDSGGTGSENGENGTGNGGGNGEEVAQTYTVTVQEIDSSYPYSEQNNVGVAYAIDGEVGAVITLERGKTYAFELESSVDSGPNDLPHPFYVGTSAEGGGGDEYNDGVENAQATTGTVTFSVPSDAPDQLFYQCGNHVYMGGEMGIEDSSGGGSSGGGGGY